MGSRLRSRCRQLSTWHLAPSFAPRRGSSMSAARCYRNPTETFWRTYCAAAKRAFCNWSVFFLSGRGKNREMARTDTSKPTRYVYVKNGDAVEQVRKFALRGDTDRSGPDAFIGSFLQAHAEDAVLVLCRS